MRIPDLILGIACCFVPYCAFIGVFAMIGTRFRHKMSIKTLEELEQRPSNRADGASNTRLLQVYAVVSLILLGALTTGGAIGAWYFLKPNLLLSLDEKSVHSIFISFAAGGAATATVLMLIFLKLFRKNIHSKKK